MIRDLQKSKIKHKMPTVWGKKKDKSDLYTASATYLRYWLIPQGSML